MPLEIVNSVQPYANVLTPPTVPVVPLMLIELTQVNAKPAHHSVFARMRSIARAAQVMALKMRMEIVRSALPSVSVLIQPIVLAV